MSTLTEVKSGRQVKGGFDVMKEITGTGVDIKIEQYGNNSYAMKVKAGGTEKVYLFTTNLGTVDLTHREKP